MSHISKSCDYCKNNNNDPLLTILKSKAAEALDKLPPILVVIMWELDRLYAIYMKDCSILDGTQTTIQSYSRKVSDLTGYLLEGHETLMNTLSHLESVVFLLGDLNECYWGMNCQTETNIYLQEYNSDIYETSGLLEEINSYVEGQTAKWEGY